MEEKKRIIVVRFNDGKELEYSIEEPISSGDKVKVDGKMAGEIGEVVSVCDMINHIIWGNDYTVLPVTEVVERNIPIGESTFDEIPDTMRVENGTLRGYTGSDVELRVPKGINAIGEYAFFENSIIEKIILPNTVTEISNNAFRRCQKLKTVICEGRIYKLATKAFSTCEVLEEIYFEKGVLHIGKMAFTSSKKLKIVSINNELKTIDNRAFFGCALLEKIDLPNGLKKIGAESFQRCKSLTTMHFPNTLESIGDEAFVGCKALINVFIPKSVKKIGYGVFDFSKKAQCCTEWDKPPKGWDKSVIMDITKWGCERKD